MRFLLGKQPLEAGAPGSDSESTSPRAAISACRDRWLTGYGTSAPVPRTATVYPRASKTPRWTAASTPRASPLTTETPARANAAPRSPATRTPYGVASRVPTIDTVRSCRSVRARWSPSEYKTRGGCCKSSSDDGYSGSPRAMTAQDATSEVSCEKNCFRALEVEEFGPPRCFQPVESHPARRRDRKRAE